MFRTPVDQVLMGSDALSFDLPALMYFPTRSAFIAMMSDPEVAVSSRHRQAALAKHNMLHLAGDPFADPAP